MLFYIVGSRHNIRTTTSQTDVAAVGQAFMTNVWKHYNAWENRVALSSEETVLGFSHYFSNNRPNTFVMAIKHGGDLKW